MFFQTYLDDLNSSTACCRSASLLIPTTNQSTNVILSKLRQWDWICQSVLIRPWGRRPAAPPPESTPDEDSWDDPCLPTEEELLFLREKYSSSRPESSELPKPSKSPVSMQRELVERHLESKSLIVPLTDDATAFILQVLFAIPKCQAENLVPPKQYIKSHGIILSDQEQYQRVVTIQNWFGFNGIDIVHNCDGNQTVSLSKEVDSFPESPPKSPHKLHESNKTNFTFVDLFAGIGGFRIGMEALGGTCIGSCEIDPHARETYRLNFLKEQSTSQLNGQEFFVNDITRLEIPPKTVDVLVGGFPCQSFSTLAGFAPEKSNFEYEKLTPIKCGRQGGLHTPQKGKLFFHLLRILRKSQPRIFIFENVKGLMRLDNGSHFQKILHLLEESGYSVIHDVIDTSWFLPQRRERVYFVGIRRDVASDRRDTVQTSSCLQRFQIYGNDISKSDDMDRFERVLHNIGIHNSTSRNPPQTLPTSRLGDILESSETVADQHPHCFLTPLQWERVQNQNYLQIHSDGSGQLLTEDDYCAQTLVSSYRQSYLMHSQFLVPRDSLYLVEQKKLLVTEARKRMHQREMKQDHIVDNDAEFINKSGNAKDQTLPRFFTPRECCRLQGFPEDFVLPFNNGDDRQRHLVSQFYRQIGNAVSPPCVAAVAGGALSSLLVPNSQDHMPEERINTAFDLVLKASPNRAKVLHAMSNKMHTALRNHITLNKC